MNNRPKRILGNQRARCGSETRDDVVILLDEGAVVPVFVPSKVRLIVRNYDYSEQSNKETIHEDDSGKLYVETIYEGRRKLL